MSFDPTQYDLTAAPSKKPKATKAGFDPAAFDLTGVKAKISAPASLLGEPSPIPFDESTSLLTWTPPGPPQSPEIRRSIASDVTAPNSMQPTSSDVTAEAIMSLLRPTLEAAPKAPQTREDLGLFQGGARELGKKVGAPFIGGMVEDLANPFTLAEGAMSEALLVPAISKLLPKKAPIIPEDLPLYPTRPSARGKMVQAQEGQMAKLGFTDEPAEFKAFHTPPVTISLDKLTGRKVETPIAQVPAPQVEASVKLAVETPAMQAGATTEKLSLESAELVKNAALDLIHRDPNYLVPGESTTRIFKRIAQGAREGTLGIDSFGPENAERFRYLGWDNIRLAKEFEDTASYSGKTQNYLSQVAKALDKATLGQIADAPNLPPTMWDKAKSLLPNVMQVWQSSLVKQLATQVRNFEQAVGEFGIQEGLNEAVVSTERLVFGKVRSPTEFMNPPLQHLFGFFRRFTPAGKEEIAKLLENEPLIAHKLYGTPVSDEISLTNKYSKFFSYGAQTQEFFAREFVFSTRIRQHLEYAGKQSLAELTPMARFKALDQAATEALEITRANYPRMQFARDFIHWMNYPVGKIIYPFARYLTNAAGAIYKWTPAKPITVAVRSLAEPGYRDAFLKLPFEEKARMVNRGAASALLFAAAAKVRNSKYAGEKYYEIRTDPDNDPGRTLDLRPFGGPMVFNLMLAEAVNQYTANRDEGKPTNLTIQDFVEGTLGINRLAGTTLFLSNIFLGKPLEDESQGWAKVKRFAGEFLGGFSTPFRTLRDFVSYYDPEEGKFRDVRQAPLTGPFRANIPYLSRTLPEKYFVTGTENDRIAPLKRQLLGLSLSEKNPLRQEVERLRISNLALEPKTGIPKLDNDIRGEMGPLVEHHADRLLSNPYYLRLNDQDKAKRIREMIRDIRDTALSRVLRQDPDLALLYKRKKSKEPEE